MTQSLQNNYITPPPKMGVGQKPPTEISFGIEQRLTAIEDAIANLSDKLTAILAALNLDDERLALLRTLGERR